MPKTKQLNLWLPPEMHNDVRKMAYKYMYTTHEEYRPIYEMLCNNPNESLGRIQYLLRQKGITPSLAGIRKIAVVCDLPYKE